MFADVYSGNGTSRRKTIGYYEKETEALEEFSIIKI